MDLSKMIVLVLRLATLVLGISAAFAGTHAALLLGLALFLSVQTWEAA